MLRIIAFSLLVLIALSTNSFAEQHNITADMVADKNTKLETLLNNRSDYTSKIKFLHEHISQDALFKLTVTNTAVSHSEKLAGKSPMIEMNKEDYINTYIQGTRFVDHYQVNIQTKGFQYNPQTGQAFSLDVMTERGTMVSELNNGKAFISQTTCRTKHEMQEDTLVSVASECHTDISFEEEV